MANIEVVVADATRTSGLRPRGVMINNAFIKASADLAKAQEAFKKAQLKQLRYDENPQAAEDAYADAAEELAASNPESKKRMDKQKATNEWKRMSPEAQQTALDEGLPIALKDGKPREIYIKHVKTS